MAELTSLAQQPTDTSNLVTMETVPHSQSVSMATIEPPISNFPLATSTPIVTSTSNIDIGNGIKSQNISMTTRGVAMATGSTPHTTRYQPNPDLSGSYERRSSKRSIKRKRFDDEVVESSLLKQERPTRDRKGRMWAV